MGDQEEKWPELSSMLGELGAKLDRLIDAGMEKALPDYADGIVLSASAQMVQLHEGYRYNYLVVSSDAATAMGSSNTLTIDTPAIKYTQPIYEGINPLNIKGSSAKLSVSGLSGQYVAQFVETNESPLVMSAGVVKLTGSLADTTELFDDIPYGTTSSLSFDGLPSYNRMVITVKNNTNETLSINVAGGAVSGEINYDNMVFSGGTVGAVPTLSIPASAGTTFLGIPVAPYNSLIPSFGTPPTSGTYSVDVYLYLEGH